MHDSRPRPWIVTLIIIAVAAVMIAGFFEFRKHILQTYNPEFVPDPDLYTIKGIDVSAHQGDVDFERVAADGIDFVILKATEGTDFKDSRFIRNYTKARKAGLRIGAYHFFRFDTDGRLQAINLLHSLRHRSLDFPVIIDVEEWGNADAVDTAEIVARLRALLRHLQFNGVEAMIYTNKDGYQRFIRNNFSDFPLWIASFSQLDSDLDWAIWQYSHRGSVNGIDGKVDLNTINPSSPMFADSLPSLSTSF